MLPEIMNCCILQNVKRIKGFRSNQQVETALSYLHHAIKKINLYKIVCINIRSYKNMTAIFKIYERK